MINHKITVWLAQLLDMEYIRSSVRTEGKRVYTLPLPTGDGFGGECEDGNWSRQSAVVHSLSQ